MVWCFDINSIKDRIICHKNTTLVFSENETPNQTHISVTITSEDNQKNSAGFMVAWETIPEAFYKLKLKATLGIGDRAFIFVETADYKHRLVPRDHWIHQAETLEKTLIFQAKSNNTMLGILFNQKDLAYQLTVETFELSRTRVRSLESDSITESDTITRSDTITSDQNANSVSSTRSLTPSAQNLMSTKFKTLNDLALARLELLQVKDSVEKTTQALQVAPIMPIQTKVVEMKYSANPKAETPKTPTEIPKSSKEAPKTSTEVSKTPKTSVEVSKTSVEVSKTPKTSTEVSKTSSEIPPKPDFFHPNPPIPSFLASREQIRIRRVKPRFETATSLLSNFTGQRIYLIVHPEIEELNTSSNNGHASESNSYLAGRDWMDYQLRSRGFEYFLVKGLLPNLSDYQKQLQANGPTFAKQIPTHLAWARQQTYLKVLEDANRQRLDKILLLETDLLFHHQIERQLNLALTQKETLKAPLVFLGWDQNASQLGQLQENTRSKLPFFFLETNHPVVVSDQALAVMVNQTIYKPILENWKKNGIRNHLVMSLQTQALKMKDPSIVFSPGLILAPNEIPIPNSILIPNEIPSTNFPKFNLAQYREWKSTLLNQNFSIRQALFSAPDYLSSVHLNAIPAPQAGWESLISFLETPIGLFKMHLINLVEGYPIPMIIVIPSYNNADNYLKNLQSVFAQDYQNYRVIYIDDVSSDQTYQLVNNYVNGQFQTQSSSHYQTQSSSHSQRINIVRQRVNQKQGSARYWAFHQAYPDELVVLLDGDDWFPHDQVLSILDRDYQKYGLMASYGSFYTSNGITNDSGNSKGINGQKTNWEHLAGQGTFPPRIIEKKRYRTFRWTSQHLRTGWAALFQQIKLSDLWHTNGRFFTTSTDCAESYPLLEMAGESHRNLGLSENTPDALKFVGNRGKILNRNSSQNKNHKQSSSEGIQLEPAKGLYVYNQGNSLIYDNSFYNLQKPGNQAQKDYHQSVQNLLQSRPVYPTVNPKIRYKQYQESSQVSSNLSLNLVVSAELWPLIQLPENWNVKEQQRIWAEVPEVTNSTGNVRTGSSIHSTHSDVPMENHAGINSGSHSGLNSTTDNEMVCRTGSPGPAGLPVILNNKYAVRRAGPFLDPDDETDDEAEAKVTQPNSQLNSQLNLQNVSSMDSMTKGPALRASLCELRSSGSRNTPSTQTPVTLWVRIIEGLTENNLAKVVANLDLPANQSLLLYSNEVFSWNKVLIWSDWLKRTWGDVFHWRSGRSHTQFVNNQMTPSTASCKLSNSDAEPIQAFTYHQKNIIPLSVDGLYKTSSLKSGKFQIGLSVISPLGDEIIPASEFTRFFNIKAKTLIYQPVVETTTTELLVSMPVPVPVSVSSIRNTSNKSTNSQRIRRRDGAHQIWGGNNSVVGTVVLSRRGSAHPTGVVRQSFEKVIRIQSSNSKKPKITGLPGVQNHYINIGSKPKTNRR